MTQIPSPLPRLRELLSKATPGPYRAHDHEDMARVGEDPSKWIGYAWVGRIKETSGPNGEFDAGWAKMDRRNDGSKEYRERASIDAHLVAETLNTLPALLDELTSLREANAKMCEALKPFARACDAFDYWMPEVMPNFAYPSHSTDITFAHEDCPTAVGRLDESDFRKAAAALPPPPADGEK